MRSICLLAFLLAIAFCTVANPIAAVVPRRLLSNNPVILQRQEGEDAWPSPSPSPQVQPSEGVSTNSSGPAPSSPATEMFGGSQPTFTYPTADEPWISKPNAANRAVWAPAVKVPTDLWLMKYNVSGAVPLQKLQENIGADETRISAAYGNLPTGIDFILVLKAAGKEDVLAKSLTFRINELPDRQSLAAGAPPSLPQVGSAAVAVSCVAAWVACW